MATAEAWNKGGVGREVKCRGGDGSQEGSDGRHGPREAAREEPAATEPDHEEQHRPVALSELALALKVV